jgi:hypothetical protein
MALTTGIFVFALLALELASLFFLARWVRDLLSRHCTQPRPNQPLPTTRRKLP